MKNKKDFAFAHSKSKPQRFDQHAPDQKEKPLSPDEIVELRKTRPGLQLLEKTKLSKRPEIISIEARICRICDRAIQGAEWHCFKGKRICQVCINEIKDLDLRGENK